MKLVFEVELQTYGESDEEQVEELLQIEKALIAVCDLAELSVGVFTSSKVVHGEVQGTR